jgi:hypothetical protein
MRKLLTGLFIFGLGFWLGGAFTLGITIHEMNGWLTLDEVKMILSWPIEAYRYIVLSG